jgi:hypothetical protein
LCAEPKVTSEGIAQRYELPGLRILLFPRRVFLERQFDLHYIFAKEEEVETVGQTVLRSVSITDQSGLGYPEEGDISQP